MKRSLFAQAVLGCVALGGSPAVAKPEKEKEKPQGPLTDVPSKPGAHVEKIKALGDNEWLDFGAPAADPKWGKARGRSWGAPMPYASDLSGGFRYGEIRSPNQPTRRARSGTRVTKPECATRRAF